MKRLFLSIITLTFVALSSTGYAQNSFLDKLEKFAGKGDSLGHFENGRYLISGDGVLALTDQSVLEGTIEFQVTSDAGSEIAFTPKDSMRPKRYFIKDIQYFTVNDHAFYALKLKMDDLSIGNKKVFVEMLNQNENDPFKLYLLRRTDPSSQSFSQSANSNIAMSYFAELPGFKLPHGLEDIKFTPFAKKMSGYLQDCPELSEKIKSKQKGYKYSILSGAGNVEVFYRIMEEYNNCERKQ